ncbi:MAG: transposase [Candidatus Parcubacteria bacterium]|nr:transposase [Candidatus Parcubacteria bacterium]
MFNQNKNKIKKNLFNELPKQVSRKDFNRYIKPHLRVPKNGPKAKISLFKIFNYILYVLHTGCQWERLPVKKKEVHWSNIYKWHNRWSKDGSYENLLWHSVKDLRDSGKLDLSILHGDGSNTVAKKGANKSATPDISIRKEKKS